MRAIRRFLNLCVTVSVLASASQLIAGEPHDNVDSRDIIEKFDCAVDGFGHLSLPVMIHNKKYLFVLDTGCAGMVYDNSFRSILGKCKKWRSGSTSAGNIELQCFDSPEAYLGNLSLKTTSSVVATDLSRLRKWTGQDYYGIIGMSFLKHHILRIDFDKGEIIFLKSPSCKYGDAFPLFFQHGVPYIETLIPESNRKERFLIDTGSDTNFSGTIRLDFYDYLKKRHIAKPQVTNHEKITLSGMPVLDADLRLKQFVMGRFTHRNLIFSTSEKCDNRLGLGYLSRYILSFDFPHNSMYLQKGKMYDIPDGIDQSGLSIGRVSGKTLVTRVAWFSEGWCSGIRSQDVILEIEGIRASQVSLFALRRLLGMEDKELHLVLQRKQKRIEVSLKLSAERNRIRD